MGMSQEHKQLLAVASPSLSDRIVGTSARKIGSGPLAQTKAEAVAGLPIHYQPPSWLNGGAMHRSFLDNDDIGTL